MGLNKRYRLGDYIARSTQNNRELIYGSDLIVGVTSEGKFSEPKGNVDGVNLKPYKIVNNGDFVYNPSRLNLGSIAYRSEGLCIVSHLYVIFHLNERGKKKILPEYLFMYLRRQEFYREVSFRNFGSQRPEFSFNDMKEIYLPIPSISAQQKVVDIYKSMKNNLETYESALEDLKLTCDGFVEDLRRELPCEKIGKYIQEENLRNVQKKIKDVLGVCKDKVFIPTIANMKGINLANYKIVKPNWFAFSNRINIGSIALRYNSPCLVSPSYTVFSVDETKILPEYLALWFQRDEFLHFAFFYSIGTVKDELDVSELGKMKIPIPDIKVQQCIVDIYNCYIERKRIAEELKEQLKNICPLLLRGATEATD